MQITASSEEITRLSPDGEVRLDRFLSNRPGEGSRQQYARAIKDGLVQLNGRKSKPSSMVRPGDRIDLPRVCFHAESPEVSPGAEPLPLEIIHRDKQLLVIDKAAGMSVHPGAGRSSGTLVNALLHHFPGIEGVGTSGRPGIVHRLDKDTSGLILVALDPKTHRALSRLFLTREISKEYLALVWGCPTPEQGIIEASIGRSPSDRKKMSVLSAGGREATTRYRVIVRAGAFALLSCELLTGRTHQIRVHLAHRGHPIVGDPLYGGRRWKNIPDPAFRALLRAFPRQALHAHRLAFVHPAHGAAVEYRSPLPDDIRELLDSISGDVD